MNTTKLKSRLNDNDTIGHPIHFYEHAHILLKIWLSYWQVGKSDDCAHAQRTQGEGGGPILPLI
ncbi:hypothetical protein HZS_796 [Henneguya salminicola]|nr:hypothetical protein HZS_796 [Henneguya salminicola]